MQSAVLYHGGKALELIQCIDARAAVKNFLLLICGQRIKVTHSLGVGGDKLTYIFIIHINHPTIFYTETVILFMRTRAVFFKNVIFYQLKC